MRERVRLGALLAGAAAAVLPACNPLACRALFADCGDSPECAAEGRCAKSHVRAGDSGMRCWADSDEDCAASEACRDEGRCAANGDGTCVRPEEVVDARTFCRESPGCTLQGWCSPIEGTCEASRDRDCAASVACATVGRCRARGGVCLAMKEKDCDESLECKAFDRCTFDENPPYLPEGGVCTKPGEPARSDYCLGPSSGCLEEGRCLRTPDDECVTPDDAGLSEPLPEALRARAGKSRPDGRPSKSSRASPADRGASGAGAGTGTRTGTGAADRPPCRDLVHHGDGVERCHAEVVAAAVSCGGKVLHGAIPADWRPATPADARGCAARWDVPPEGSAGPAWAIAHCLRHDRVGLPLLDSWYRLFRRPDGALLPEVGTGRASLGETCGRRAVGIDARGTLVAPIECVPLALPAADVALRRRVLEDAAATFVFDLVGAPATVARGEFYLGELVDSLRATPSAALRPGGTARKRPCP